EHLLAAPAASITPAMTEAVAAFLEAGTDRLGELRRRAARWLFRRGDGCAFPVLLGSLIQPEDAHLVPRILTGAEPALVDAAIEAVLLTGPRAAPERLVITLLTRDDVDPDARERAWERLLAEALHQGSRSFAASCVSGKGRAPKLRALAET